MDKVKLKTVFYNTGYLNQAIKINDKEVFSFNCWEDLTLDNLIDLAKEILDTLNIDYEYSEENQNSHH